MDQKNEQKAPLRIKNLAELKRCIRPGTELVATSHSKHPALVGLVRVVTEVQTNAYYSVVKDQPTHQYSTCNYGKGFRSDFEKASNYLFEGTTIKVLDRRSGDNNVLYEMELYPGECLMPGQKSDTEENEGIREDDCEIKQKGMGMTLSLWQRHNIVIDLGHFCRPAHIIHCCIRFCKRYIASDTGVHKHRILKHKSNIVIERLRGNIS